MFEDQKSLKQMWRKIVGKWKTFKYVDDRARLRSIVYNWVLQTEHYGVLQRLWEREPTYSQQLGGWVLKDIHGVGHEGFIHERHVTQHEFDKAFEQWGWLDDDSNFDTTDRGFIEELVHGKRRNHLWALLFRKQLKVALGELHETKYGNSFDLGDMRGQYPYYNKYAMLAWNDRNTAMNFQYWENY